MRITVLVYSSLFLVTSAHADTVRLRIVGPDQKPVTGARIRILESSGGWRDRKVEALRDLSSDEAGNVTFESKNPLVAAAKQSVVEPFAVYVRVTAPGFALMAQSLKAGDNEITLQTGRSWGGIALDESRKPVAGVKLVLTDLEGEKKSVYLPKELELQAVTDADGKWDFPGIPRQGSARITVWDARFVRESLNLPLKGEIAPPLFLERGATIKGRLLTPQGTGAANVPLSPGGYNGFNLDDDFRTDPDGRFEFSSLRAGDYYLQYFGFHQRDLLPFIVDPKSVKVVKSGEVRDIGNWKAEVGLAVKGKVINGETKAPIANASISLWGNNGQGTSDKTGEFAFRSMENVSQSTISATGFVSLQKSVPAPVKGVLDLGTIELKPGIEVTGILKNQAGQNIPDLQIYVEENRSRVRQYGYVDNGQISFQSLAPGNYTLKSTGHKFISGATFSVAKGQKTPPLEVVMETASVAETPKKLVGRAVDNNGQPVVGAKIVLHIVSLNGSYQTVRVVSGGDGSFEVGFSMDGGTPKVESVFYPELLNTRNDIKVVDDRWRADLFFQARGSALRGRVVSSAGQPVARAFVSLLGRNDVPIVQSDENGGFSLPDVPLEGVTLVASTGRGYGETPVSKSGAPLEIKLQSGADYDPVALADEILPSAQVPDIDGEVGRRRWDALGTTRMETAILQTKSEGRYWHWNWIEYLRLLARRDPAAFLARGDELAAQIPEGSFEASALLATLRARSSDPTDREKARTWLDAEAKKKREINMPTVGLLLKLGIVAECLKAGDGANWEEYAAQVASQLSDQVRANNAREWGQSAASISMAAFDDFILDWKMNAQLNAMHGALLAFLYSGDIATTRQMFQRIETSVPAAEAAPDKIKIEGFVQKPKDILGQVRGQFASELSKTEPAEALELAHETSDYMKSKVLLNIARNAVKLGRNEVATKALREVFESKYSNVEPGAEAAAIALGYDPKLADELFQKCWKMSKPHDADQDFGFRPSIAAYAEARAKNWGGESRILIEREWVERIKSYKPRDDNDYDSNLESLEFLTAAMAKVDARRALEMVKQLPEKGTSQAKARGKIMVALLEK